MANKNAVGNALTGSTGSGAFVGATSPTLITPVLGTPSSGTLTNCTGLPVAGGGSGRSSTTAYALIAGGTTSTGAEQSLGTGTSNQVLASNGSSSLPTFQSIMPRTCGFRAYLNGTQSLTLNTHTKITLSSESYDYDGTFDNATNYRHTPTVGGKYLYVGYYFSQHLLTKVRLLQSSI